MGKEKPENRVECERCGYIIEDYNNVYGTWCRKCNHFIKPLDEPEFVKENKLKLKILQQEFLEKWRNKYKKGNIK